MGYRTIVVGTDGSVTATVARDEAIRLARRCRARLVMVLAYPGGPMTIPMARSILEHAEEAARAKKVEAVVELASSEPAEALLEAAERTRRTCWWRGTRARAGPAGSDCAACPT